MRCLNPRVTLAPNVCVALLAVQSICESGSRFWGRLFRHALCSVVSLGGAGPLGKVVVGTRMTVVATCGFVLVDVPAADPGNTKFWNISD